jgi:hypothetical protein
MAMLRPDELPLQRQTRCRQDLIEMGQRFTHRQVKTMSTDDQGSEFANVDGKVPGTCRRFGLAISASSVVPVLTGILPIFQVTKMPSCKRHQKIITPIFQRGTRSMLISFSQISRYPSHPNPTPNLRSVQATYNHLHIRTSSTHITSRPL